MQPIKTPSLLQSFIPIIVLVGIFIVNVTIIYKANALDGANQLALLFLAPITVIGLIIIKLPAIPVLFIGSLFGGVFAIIFQPNLILSLSVETNFLVASYKAVIDSMTTNVSIVTKNELVNGLVSSGGMAGMLDTIWLIICTMIFGGAMEKAGMLKRITQSIIRFSKTNGSLIATTTSSCKVFNITASDQYLAIVVPGRMFANEYKERGLHPKVLSRTLEDSGTVTSALIPWNTCGAYVSGVLGLSTGECFMYYFFNLISPIITMTFGFLGIKIVKFKAI